MLSTESKDDAAIIEWHCAFKQSAKMQQPESEAVASAEDKLDHFSPLSSDNNNSKITITFNYRKTPWRRCKVLFKRIYGIRRPCPSDRVLVTLNKFTCVGRV